MILMLWNLEKENNAIWVDILSNIISEKEKNGKWKKVKIYNNEKIHCLYLPLPYLPFSCLNYPVFIYLFLIYHFLVRLITCLYLPLSYL
ncbi:MAG: hypothetical protein ACRCYP_02570, partial [Alphaproteobacteria bacterium]